MEQKTVELYQKDELKKLRRRLIIEITALTAVVVLTLIICILICRKVTLYNAKNLLFWCVGTSVLGSWIALSVRIFAVDGTRCAIRHTEAMLEGERERITGTFVLTDERVRVKNGVSMIRVRHEGLERTGVLQLYDRKRDRFNASHAAAVSVVHGFVVAYEEDIVP